MSSKHLLRQFISHPLPSLKQGSTLQLRSKIKRTNVRIRSQWRDDGHFSMLQRFCAVGGTEADVSVARREDKLTSLGRKESNVVIELEKKEAITVEEEEEEEEEKSMTQSPSHPSQGDPQDGMRVILDGESIVPDSKQWSDLTEGFRRINYNDGSAHATETEAVSEEPETLIEVDVPEKVNLECDLVNGGSVHIENKIEGDVRILTADGDVVVQKLRGHAIDIRCHGPGNIIAATDLLEAETLTVSLPDPGRLRAKKIHANSFEAHLGDEHSDEAEQYPNELYGEDDGGAVCDISSLYVTGEALINIASSHPSRQAVRVKSNHGHVVVEAIGTQSSAKSPMTEEPLPNVYMGGVNGSCEVFVRRDGSTENDSSTWTSSQVHFDSISPESVSVIQADMGDVNITVDRKVETDLRMLSSPNVSDVDIDTIVEEETANHEGQPSELNEMIRNIDNSLTTATVRPINIQTKAFTERNVDLSLKNSEYIDGWLENKSAEPDSRFDRKTRGGSIGSVGKIRLEGAEDQALRGFQDDKGTNMFQRPLLVVAAAGGITLETLSWLGNVARRYGLDGKRDKEMLGRTATRRGRSFLQQGKE